MFLHKSQSTSCTSTHLDPNSNDMQIGCTEMHPFTLGVIVIEFIMFGALGLNCLERPFEKERIGYFLFLALLLLFNITNGIMPNTFLGIPLLPQYILRNGVGFITVSYFPFLFFKKLQIIKINNKFQKAIDAPILLIAPYPIFFAIIYLVYHDVELAHRYTLFIPCVNNMTMLMFVHQSIWNIVEKHRNRERSTLKILSFITMLTWLLLYPIIHLNLGKATETVFINIGPTLLNIFHLYNWIKNRRREQKRFQNLISLAPDEEIVTRNCRNFALSERETEITILLFHHLKRQQIADKLFISVRTVDKHIERVFLKTGVSSREQLFDKLND